MEEICKANWVKTTIYNFDTQFYHKCDMCKNLAHKKGGGYIFYNIILCKSCFDRICKKINKKLIEVYEKLKNHLKE